MIDFSILTTVSRRYAESPEINRFLISITYATQRMFFLDYGPTVAI